MESQAQLTKIVKNVLDDCQRSIFWFIENNQALINVGAPLNNDLSKMSFREAITLVYIMRINETLHTTNVELKTIIKLLDNGVLNEDELNRVISQKVYLQKISTK